jgi:hypothetical protein
MVAGGHKDTIRFTTPPSDTYEADKVTTDEAVKAIELGKYLIEKSATETNSPNYMSPYEAVRYLEHGPEMVEAMKYALPILSPYNHTTDRTPDRACHLIREALAKMEGK